MFQLGKMYLLRSPDQLRMHPKFAQELVGAHLPAMRVDLVFKLRRQVGGAWLQRAPVREEKIAGGMRC